MAAVVSELLAADGEEGGQPLYVQNSIQWNLDYHVLVGIQYVLE